jgi:hypothetical protein
MMRALRNLALRRDLLVARSAAQRGQLGATLRPASLRLAAAQSVAAGVRGVLYWAVQLAPLYSLLRHNISRRGENR